MYTKFIVLVFSACVYVRVICDEVTEKGQQFDTEKIYFPNDFLIKDNQYTRPTENYKLQQPDNYQHQQPNNHEVHQSDKSQHRQPDNYEVHQPDYYEPREDKLSVFRYSSENTHTDSYLSDERSKNNKGEDEERYTKNSTSMKIPLDFIQNINEYNVSDLLLNFLDGDVELDDEPFIKTALRKTLPLITSSMIVNIKNRFGNDDGARSAAIIPKAAGCTPEKTTIKLATSTDPSVLYIPQCTKVERCNGCCSHNLLSCQPVEKEIMSYQVIKTQYTGGKKLKALKKEIVLVKKHTKCKCDCKVKAEDCNKYQEYRPSECRCACTNFDEEKKCYKHNSSKLWDPNICACQCRDIFSCSTGYAFDHNECRCNPLSPRLSFSLKHRGTTTKDDLIDSLDEGL